jgi:NAD(P)-dependent dehydrogenase (short-subunit alcohol dehydrogenase family)
MLDDRGVLDGTQVVSGSLASMTLADVGAAVITVARPVGGDVGPPDPAVRRGISSDFASVNRNKRAISLDSTDPAGRDVVLDLAEPATVSESVGEVRDAVGKTDALVNNAGIAGPSVPFPSRSGGLTSQTTCAGRFCALAKEWER